MLRKDGGERGTEFMVDQEGCGSGKHQLCCPPDDVPTCGWYTHNNGKCDQKCPVNSELWLLISFSLPSSKHVLPFMYCQDPLMSSVIQPLLLLKI